MTSTELNRLSVRATLHCLTGCAIGEISGNVIGSSLNWPIMMTEILAISLAFLFGYALTMRPLIRHGIGFGRSTKLALKSDTISIATMETVDTTILLLLPGAVYAGPASLVFWGSLTFALFIAFLVAVPVNRYLIARGKGHAVIHSHHH